MSITYNVKVYSLSKEGNIKVRPNFRVREFRCQDGSDAVFVGDEIADVVQDLRDASGDEVYINSAYRTQPHNARVGGEKYSNHLYGIAVDVRSKVWSAKQVFDYLDAKYHDKYAIGYYRAGYVHIDTQPDKERWFS